VSATNGTSLRSLVMHALDRDYGLTLERRHGRWVTIGNHPGFPFGERRWPSLKRLAEVMNLDAHNDPADRPAVAGMVRRDVGV
jgi:hypothetical protein